MKQLSLSGSLRRNVGKKDAAELRSQGKVPAVIYGGPEQVHFFFEENEAKKMVFTPEVYLLQIEIDGKAYKAILQDLQIHPVKDTIQHMDFLEVVEGKPVNINIPVVLEGQAKGVLNGGRLSRLFRRLQIEAMESDLPDAVNIDITPLRIGEKVRVGDLKYPGVKFLDPESAVVVAVRVARGAIEDEEEEEEGEEGEEGEGEEGAEGKEGEKATGGKEAETSAEKSES
jgi:large subunit ribosomal protein L25